MNKILRYSLMALLAIVGLNNAMAEDVIWQEDWSTWGDYVKKVLDGVNSNYTFEGTVTNTDGSFKSGTTIYNESLAGGQAPELMLAKSGGSFAAKIAMNGKSGDMTLTFKANFKNNNSTIEITATGATVGEQTVTGTDVVVPVSVTGSEVVLTFKTTTTANVRMDNFRLFQGQGKKLPGIAWGKASASVTFGNTEEYEKYIPNLQNPNNLTVECTSSETSVATVSSAGVITVVGVGETTVTASFAGNDEYEAASVSLKLTVKEATTPEPPAQEITVARALEIINGLDDGATTTDKYKVKGFIVGTPDFQRDKDNKLYGNCNFEIADTKGGATKLTVYRAQSFENKKFTEDDVTANILKEGDEVVLEGQLQKYVKNNVTTPEIKNCYLISINGKTSHVSALKADFQNAPAYNVGGQRVNQGYKGLVIKGGRKLIQK